MSEQKAEKERRKLRKLTSTAKYFLVKYLRNHSEVLRRELEPYILQIINMHKKRDGTITHITKPIHEVAFILAYKDLESKGEIIIKRGNIPFPMTDFESVFTLSSQHNRQTYLTEVI